MLQRYNIFLAQRAKLGKMKKEKILHPSVATGFNDMARLGKRGQKDRMCRMTDVYFIVFHCVSFMFFYSCVFIFDKST